MLWLLHAATYGKMLGQHKSQRYNNNITSCQGPDAYCKIIISWCSSTLQLWMSEHKHAGWSNTRRGRGTQVQELRQEEEKARCNTGEEKMVSLQGKGIRNQNVWAVKRTTQEVRRRANERWMQRVGGLESPSVCQLISLPLMMMSHWWSWLHNRPLSPLHSSSFLSTKQVTLTFTSLGQ